MRLMLFAGKGGTGKTSMAAATAALAAERGARTLVMSLDPAHSLRDAFDIEKSLADFEGGPTQVAGNLWFQELNINVEIHRYWKEVHGYLSALFATAGLDDVVAEEIAILPGMEELSALLHINDYVREDAWDALILDCAPTAESMRFVSLPTALEWYMEKVFRMERNLFRVARPLAKRFTDMPLPDDDYFRSVEFIADRLAGVNEILMDPSRTTVRLVCNPEKMVLRETQRAFMYFSLHGLAVEAVFLNRILPDMEDGPFAAWAESQRHYIGLAEEYFSPVPIRKVPLREGELLGHDMLLDIAREIYGDEDPLEPMYTSEPLRFEKRNGSMQARLHLPWADKSDVEIHKVADELVVRVGVFRKHIALPHSFAVSRPGRARFEGEHLVVDFIEKGETGNEREA